MKKKSVVTVLFPSVFMIILTIVGFFNKLDFNGIDYKAIFILTLTLLIPLLFLLQGIISAITNTNIFLSLGVSILYFILLMIVYLNESASIYILIGLTLGAVGYLITKLIVKIK